ncbi:MAG: hypothetical protein Q7I95_08070, partial [Thiobacillus sp.]|nr:hypothetical protein [Thiobacillus sp.]
MLVDALAPENLVLRIAHDNAYVRAVPLSVDHGRHHLKIFDYPHSFTPTGNCKPAVTRNLPLSIVLINFLMGCSNLMTAERPDHVLAEIHEFGTTALAYTANGQRFISGGFKGDIRVWNAATRKPLGEMRGHNRAVRAILTLPSGDFVSGSDDGRLILWHDGRIRAQHAGAAVTALALFQGQVVSGHADGRVRIWSQDTLRPLRERALDTGVVALN